MLYVGYHTIAFTPTSTSAYLQFRNETVKDIFIDDISIIDDAPIALKAPYGEADLQSITPAQSADVMYLFHQDYPTYKLERRGHTTWSLVRVAWQDGPWLTQNDTTTPPTPPPARRLNLTITPPSVAGTPPHPTPNPYHQPRR